MMGAGGWPKPNWRSKGNMDARYQPNELERSKHRATHALKYIAGLGDDERPLTFKEKTLIEIGQHAAHADEAMQQNQVDRAQDHIDKMNALARQIRTSNASTMPAPEPEMTVPPPALEIATDPARVVKVGPTAEEIEAVVMGEAEDAFLKRSLSLLQDEPTTDQDGFAQREPAGQSCPTGPTLAQRDDVADEEVAGDGEPPPRHDLGGS